MNMGVKVTSREQLIHGLIVVSWPGTSGCKLDGYFDSVDYRLPPPACSKGTIGPLLVGTTSLLAPYNQPLVNFGVVRLWSTKRCASRKSRLAMLWGGISKSWKA